jgi:protein TonB
MKFLNQNLNQDVTMQYNAPIGYYTVVISFLVKEDGSVGELEVIKDPGYGTGQEVLRVFKKAPKWIPAIMDGVPVIYRQKQSMTFSVFQN